MQVCNTFLHGCSEQTVLERQDLPCTYLAHHKLQAIINLIIVITIIIISTSSDTFHPCANNVHLDTSGSNLQTESGQGYDLDRSLFERLVGGGSPVATLEQQRRMRPSIAALIRNTIYPSLQVRLHFNILYYTCKFGH